MGSKKSRQPQRWSLRQAPKVLLWVAILGTSFLVLRPAFRPFLTQTSWSNSAQNYHADSNNGVPTTPNLPETSTVVFADTRLETKETTHESEQAPAIQGEHGNVGSLEHTLNVIPSSTITQQKPSETPTEQTRGTVKNSDTEEREEVAKTSTGDRNEMVTVAGTSAKQSSGASSRQANEATNEPHTHGKPEMKNTTSNNENSFEDAHELAAQEHVVHHMNRLLSDTRLPPEYYTNYTYPKTDAHKRANAAIVLLTREEEKWGLVTVLKSFERTFNRKYGYPYLMYNDKPFTESFKRDVQAQVSTNITFVTLPQDLWEVPDHINMTKTTEAMARMEREHVIYGGSLSYRKMCRFFSGTLFQHPEIQKYDYYWRLDSSNVKFHCDMEFDPFVLMQERDLVYGFTIALHEYYATVPTLWKTTASYMKEKNPPASWMNYFTDDGKSYNGHHFWSNFEIGSVNFFAGDQYQDYFKYLDQSGGFFYERWGDAPVHSLGVGLFARKDQVHWFNEIGYTHAPFSHCPVQPEARARCDCQAANQADHISFSSLYDFLALEPRTVEQQVNEYINTTRETYKKMLAPTRRICPAQIDTQEGGHWRMCKSPPLQHPCVVYSFGTKGGEMLTSFEQAAAKKGCEVHVFNQFGRADQYIQINTMLSRMNAYGLQLHHYTLSETDGDGQRWHEESHMALSDRRLSTIRKMFGHDRTIIDAIKIDLEGEEWPVLAEMIQSGTLATVNQVLVELHFKSNKLWKYFQHIPMIFEGLRAQGFVVGSHSLNPSSQIQPIGTRHMPCCVKVTFRRRKTAVLPQE